MPVAMQCCRERCPPARHNKPRRLTPAKRPKAIKILFAHILIENPKQLKKALIPSIFAKKPLITSHSAIIAPPAKTHNMRLVKQESWLMKFCGTR
jgi:hypothetical protein